MNSHFITRLLHEVKDLQRRLAEVGFCAASKLLIEGCDRNSILPQECTGSSGCDFMLTSENL